MTSYNPRYLPPNNDFPPLEGASPLYIDGQRATATQDGVPISGIWLTALINSGMIGGQFGLTERFLRQSDPRLVGFRVGFRWFEPTLDGATHALGYAFENNFHEVLNRYWSVGNVSVPNISFGRQTQTLPTSLSGDDLEKWRSERGRLLKLLGWIGDKGKTDCRRYLESKGFDVNKIRDSLRGQTPYDAFRSLNDAGEDFGITGITVKEFFDNWAAQGKSFEGGAATGNTGRIFYSSAGILLSVILHETIHATHKGKGTRVIYDPTNPKSDPMTGIISFGPGTAPILDSELQDRLGINRQPDSTNITAELERRGCK